MVHCCLILRGHIRDAFKNDKMYLFTKKLVELYNVDVYIHTWNIVQKSLSWRPLLENNTPVTENTITDYFKDIPIKKIIIDDNSKIEIFGRTTGTICRSKLPILAWKNMWYGIYQITNAVPKDSFIINTRFDYFNLHPGVIVDENKLLKSIDLTNVNISFAINKPSVGVDNFYCGPYGKIYSLTKDFRYNLDTIEHNFKMVGDQEKIVFLYANNLSQFAGGVKFGNFFR